MVLGVTYAGEIARTGASQDPEQAVELVCTNPRFVELASAKKPNFIIRLFNGALSFPRDWWYGTTFIAMRMGLFGVEGKVATDGTANTIINLINTAISNPGFALRTLRAIMGHLLHYPELYARQGVMMGTGVVIGMASGSPVFTFSVAVANFILATTGAVARVIDNGASSLAEIMIAAAIGESDPAVAHAVGQELQRFSPSDGNYDIPTEDEAHLLYILKGVLHCVRNPGMYAQNGDRTRVQRTVAVGQVSSARPRGVMGSIPVGYETNALDAISEDNRLLNEWLRVQRQ